VTESLWHAFILSIAVFCGLLAIAGSISALVRYRRIAPKTNRPPLDWIAATWPEIADALLSLPRPGIIAYAIVICRRLHGA
jgi:hypothetical protein